MCHRAIKGPGRRNGPIGEDVRGALGAEVEKDVEFKWIPGGLILTFPAERAAKAPTLLTAKVATEPLDPGLQPAASSAPA